MKLSKLMMVFAMCAVTLTGTAQTKVIAHRGYWKCEGSAQNSIASLTKAAEAKVYGSEFDVQLTKDKEIVVNHDDSIQGICIFDTPFAELKDKVKKMRMEKQVEYISFSMNICEQLVKLTPDSEIAYLKSDVAPKDLKAKGINGIDYYIKVLAEKPEWIAEAHQLGMKVNVWTVNDMEMVQKMIDQQVDYITTDYPLEIEKLIRKNGGDS